jgi:hypothetical protein
MEMEIKIKIETEIEMEGQRRIWARSRAVGFGGLE